MYVNYIFHKLQTALYLSPAELKRHCYFIRAAQMAPQINKYKCARDNGSFT